MQPFVETEFWKRMKTAIVAPFCNVLPPGPVVDLRRGPEINHLVGFFNMMIVETCNKQNKCSSSYINYLAFIVTHTEMWLYSHKN